jgi:fumarate reductase subunit C
MVSCWFILSLVSRVGVQEEGGKAWAAKIPSTFKLGTLYILNLALTFSASLCHSRTFMLPSALVGVGQGKMNKASHPTYSHLTISPPHSQPPPESTSRGALSLYQAIS